MPLTIEPLDPRHHHLLPRLLASANEAPLDLRTVAHEKVFEPGRSGDPVTWIARHGESAVGVATVCGHFLRLIGVAREFRGRGVGSALLDTAEHHMRAERRASISIGAESGNYFVPGVVATDLASLSFFERRGYTSPGDAIHLEVDLPPPALKPPSGIELSDATLDDRNELSAFIRSEFAEAWAFEVERGFGGSAPPVVLARRDGAIRGFAGYELNNRGIGTFGPAGVSASERHAGTGRALLLSALERLHRRGFERAVIQWAAALPFYEKSAGARIMARFRLLGKAL